MNPGQLKDRIIVKVPYSSSLDRFGQTEVTYASSSVWANVKKQGGNEVNANGLIVSNATYIFTIRHREDVDEKAILNYEGTDYNVVFVDEIGNDMYLRLTGDRI
jgi:SPP1 family predicted phage head-tail adaptor